MSAYHAELQAQQAAGRAHSVRNVTRTLRPADQLLHVTYHSFLADPKAAVARAHAFIGVDPTFKSPAQNHPSPPK